jgi:hypothetical protein
MFFDTKFDAVGTVMSSLLNASVKNASILKKHSSALLYVSPPTYPTDEEDEDDAGTITNIVMYPWYFTGTGSVDISKTRGVGVYDEIWIGWSDSQQETKFKPLGLGYPIYRGIEPIGAIAFSGMGGTDAILVTTLEMGDIELTRDGIIKARPSAMSETLAFKLLGKIKGHVSIGQAVKHLHRLNVYRE